MPADFEAACSRAPACAGAEPEPVWARIGAARRQPAGAARHRQGAGTRREARKGHDRRRRAWSTSSATRPRTSRSTGSSTRPPARCSKTAKRRRCCGSTPSDSRSTRPTSACPPREYSVEDYFAVGCLDYPQLFDMGAAPTAAREGTGGRRAPRCRPAPSAPSPPPSGSRRTRTPRRTRAAWTGPRRSTRSRRCLSPPPLLPSGLPVLVLGGELDTWTPAGDVPAVLAELGGHSRFVELANATHVVGEGETSCGSALIQGIRRPAPATSTRSTPRARPASPAIHSVGAFPRRGLHAVTPLEPRPATAPRRRRCGWRPRPCRQPATPSPATTRPKPRRTAGCTAAPSPARRAERC